MKDILKEIFEFLFPEHTEAELCWQMAVGMAFGTKNLTHDTYTSVESDDPTMVGYATWSTSELYDRIKKINREYLVWDTIYNSYAWQGCAALDFGQSNNGLFDYKEVVKYNAPLTAMSKLKTDKNDG